MLHYKVMKPWAKSPALSEHRTFYGNKNLHISILSCCTTYAFTVHFSGICLPSLPSGVLGVLVSHGSSREACPCVPGRQLLLRCTLPSASLPWQCWWARSCSCPGSARLSCTDGEPWHMPPTCPSVPLSIWFLCWSRRLIGVTRKLISLSSTKLLLKFLMFL